MANVLVVGSINMDLVVKAPRMPEPGETLVGGVFTVVPGGKGANQAAAAARLGCSVRMIGAVGSDEFGTAAIKNLKDQGVDTNTIVTAPAGIATGVAIIIVDQSGQNTIVVASGANASLEPGVLSSEDEQFQWADLVALQCEVPIETVLSAIRHARKGNARVVLNAAPAIESLPEEALQVDYLVVNELEAETITGIRPTSIETALDAAKLLHERGASHAIVTLGAAGCVYVDDQLEMHEPAPSVAVVDTTAAGDAFVGALTAALGRGLMPRQTLVYANCAGALAVTKLGAQASLPDASSVETLYQQTIASRA